MVSITREQFDEAVNWALAVALLHGKSSVGGENPSHFRGIELTDDEKALITNHYDDVIQQAGPYNDFGQYAEGKGDVWDDLHDKESPLNQVLADRRGRYEQLILDYLETDNALENRQAFLGRQDSTLQLPALHEVDTPTSVFLCGPYGIGDADFVGTLQNQATSLAFSNIPLFNGLRDTFAQGAIVLGIERAQHILRTDQQEALGQLDTNKQSTLLRADQSALTIGIEQMIGHMQVNTINTERFVHPSTHDTGKIEKKLNPTDDDRKIIIVASKPANEEALKQAAEKRHIPIAQVVQSGMDFSGNIERINQAAKNLGAQILRYDHAPDQATMRSSMDYSQSSAQAIM